MPNSNTVASEQLDYPFLLLTHIVCADQQIHSEESKALRELAKQARIGRNTLEEMEKILVQDEHHLCLKDVASKVPLAQHSESMRQILAIAYVDGFFSPLEREIIEQVAQIWNWSEGEIELFIEEAEGFTAKRSIKDDNNQSELSLGARLLTGAESILSRSLVSKLAALAPESVGQQIEKLQREILLAGPEYDEAIQQCAAIANEDYKFAEVALKLAYAALFNLGKNIQLSLEEIKCKTNGKGKATTAKEVAKQLKDTSKSLSTEIIKEIEGVRESLRAKQRALNHFSIAFMGKTKAGKSTLHAIITCGGWDAIGTGMQRTTRLNRVYEWNNIRIIDTPGIGAPGGKTDEEIAQSVIEESDVICYVVTNDSIQETEFGFLRLLKEKAKPLIILLNVKQNLRDSRRLEYFLKDSNKLFAMEGKSGLDGHIRRIREYAKKHYTNDYFEIIPVMLLAAQMASEPEHKKIKDKLFKASRVQDFLDSIRESLVKHGTIRRSQTLLGSTVGAVEHPYNWVTQQAEVYKHLTDTLKNERRNFNNDVQKTQQYACDLLLQEIEDIFQEVLNAVPDFAEDYWDATEYEMNLGWEEELKYIGFEERLQIAYEETSQEFNQEVQQALEEIGHELQLVIKLSGGNLRFYEQDVGIFDRNFMRIGGTVLAIAGTVTSFLAFPIGISITIVGGVIGMISGWFKSRNQKRREAVQKISNSLISQLESNEKDILKQAKSNFTNSCDHVASSINTYFDELIQGLDAIAIHLEAAKSKLSQTDNYLNRAYAKRIIDWCCEQYEPLTDESIHKTIATVKRDFGRSIHIQTKSNCKRRKSLDKINLILEEDVSIQSLKSSK
ncbi:MAG: GTPase [Symploca sp. SIO2E9]|nr:GTPase [Symploca sp. SIO2E9]